MYLEWYIQTSILRADHGQGGDSRRSIVENAQSSMLSRREVKPYLKRKDWPGLLYLAVHFSMIGGTGYLVYLATGTGWIVPAIVLHGLILSTLFHPLHECIHGTAFRTRWLNEAVMQILGFIYIWPGLLFRYDHALHHSHTQIQGEDTEMAIPIPRNLGDYLIYVSRAHASLAQSRLAVPSLDGGGYCRRTRPTCPRANCPRSSWRPASC